MPELPEVETSVQAIQEFSNQAIQDFRDHAEIPRGHFHHMKEKYFLTL